MEARNRHAEQGPNEGRGPNEGKGTDVPQDPPRSVHMLHERRNNNTRIPQTLQRLKLPKMHIASICPRSDSTTFE